MSAHRLLSGEEIRRLEAGGCRCADWRLIKVAPDFRPEAVRDVVFAGTVVLGAFASAESGLYRLHLRDSSIGDNALVCDVPGGVSRYDIGDGARVTGAQCLRFEGESACGNGTSLSVLVESGGREVVIHEGLSAQEAYLQAFSRTPQDTHKLLVTIALREARRRYATRGRIGAGAIVAGCGQIINSAIGEHGRAEGCALISGTTVNGAAGAGTVLKECILAVGAEVGAGCLLERCFVAGGARLGEGFSAENSLFFANCECFRGEACAVFAGPHTVSHHKSTLLLAGLYSFYNAGSGTNFSNHRYKLGAVHQGIMERGCKSGSGSYLLWPGQIGSYSTVIGKHSGVVDIAAYPFSLLLQQGERSVLLPGANLFSAGLERDLRKWPKRDRRRPDSPDLITYAGFSPYNCERIFGALSALRELQRTRGPVQHNGIEIPRDYIEKSLARYHAALNLHFGSLLARSLEAGRGEPGISAVAGNGPWVDLAGLLAPARAVESLLEDVTGGQVKDCHHLQNRLREMSQRYEEYEWSWLCRRLGAGDGELPRRAVLKGVLDNWQEAARLRAEILQRDARKEFAPEMMTGYGLLGEREADFLAVRGEFSQCEFSETVQARAQEIAASAQKLESLLPPK